VHKNKAEAFGTEAACLFHVAKVDDTITRGSKESGTVQPALAVRRLFIIAHGDEGAMPQVPGISPFEESDLADQFRCDPVAFLHLFRSQ
jgi:hypothetical protein